MTKIFLSGVPGVGKSTLIRKILALRSGSPCGFLTWFGPDRCAPDRFLYMSDLEKKCVREAVRYGNASVSEVCLSCFNEFGSSLLVPPPGSDLIIMDELGRLEGRAEDFKAAVFKALDGPLPVLGVLRHDAHGWLDDIRAHPDVRLLDIDEHNRDNLAEEIVTALHG